MKLPVDSGFRSSYEGKSLGEKEKGCKSRETLKQTTAREHDALIGNNAIYGIHWVHQLHLLHQLLIYIYSIYTYLLN